MEVFLTNAPLKAVWVIVWVAAFKPSWADSSLGKGKLYENPSQRKLTGVYFDPGDFIVHNSLQISLDESGLTALLEKIQSRFDTIMVPVNIPESKVGNFSNVQLPEVVARRNLLLNKSISSSLQQLKVVILIKVQSFKNDELLNSGFQEIQKVMDRANFIFDGTVGTVVLNMWNLEDGASDNYFKFRNFFAKHDTGNKVGIKIDIKDALDALLSNSKFSQNFKSDVLRNHSLNHIYFTEDFVDLIERTSAAEAFNHLESQFWHCKTLFQKLNSATEMALITTWADTNEKGVAKYDEFVEFWRRIVEWAEKSRASVIFVQAFDNLFPSPFPFHNLRKLVRKTNGWWRLIPNSSYTHPSQFAFLEKASIIHGDGIESEITNLTWLRQPTVFSTSVVGIHFNPPGLETGINKSDLDDETSIPTLIRQISTKFSKVYISTVLEERQPYLNSWERKQTIFSVPLALARWNKNESRENALEIFIEFDKTTADNASISAMEANELFPGTVKQLIYSLPNKNELVDVYATMLKLSNQTTFKFAVKLELDVCIAQSTFKNVMDKMHADFFDDLNINLIYFSEILHSETSKLGRARLLPFLTAMFENCKKTVDRYFSKQKKHVGASFITGWPINGEESLEGLVHFVAFWEGISAWASKTNTTVILSTAFDPVKTGRILFDVKPGTKYGWWSVKANSTVGEKFVFEDRKQVAFRYVSEKLHKDSENSTPSITVIAILVATVGTFVAVALLTMVYLLRKRQSDVLTKKEISQFFKGGDTNETYLGVSKNINGPYHKLQWELAKKSFSIEETSPLGSGAFGRVCRGTVNQEGETKEVAVKMTKIHSAGYALRGILFEIKILSYLGNHPYIVGLVGSYTAELRKGKAFVFLELCALGSLLNYLRERKPSSHTQQLEDPHDFEDETTELDDLLVSDMARWSFEIANGMEHIASKHIVHLDIAARNVLLTAEKHAKITDFGLSRRMYDYQSYMKKHQEPLPWRSMAPESLKMSKFTEKSDVWSFGVLLWEIYSLGEEPFPGLSWDVNFSTKLERGLRLGEPAYNRSSMYSTMLRCWSTNPERRPTFSTLAIVFKTMLLGSQQKTSETNYKDCDPEDNRITDSISPCSTAMPNVCTEDNANDININQSSPTENEEIGPTAWWIWSSLAVVLLLILIIISICLQWKTGAMITLETFSNDGDMNPALPPLKKNDNLTMNNDSHQITQNKSDSAVRSTFVAENGTTMKLNVRNKTALGFKLLIAINGWGDREETVRILVQCGADVNVRGERNRTPLISAAANCGYDKDVCLRIIKILMEHGANVTAKDDRYWTFLHTLVYDGNITPTQFHNISDYLVSKNMSSLFNALPDGRRRGVEAYHNFTPLELALKKIEAENRTLQLLNMNGVRFKGSYALTNALSRKGSPQLLSVLTELGVRWKNITDFDRESSPLHFAASICYAKGVKYFLQGSQEINSRSDSLGWSPLHLAVRCTSGDVLETVRVLIENGASVSLKDKAGNTPLSFATENKYYLPNKHNVIQLLREADL